MGNDYGKYQSEETRDKKRIIMSQLNLGKKLTDETRKKMRAAAPHRSLFTPRKEKHYRWKGGVSFKRGYDWKDTRKFILTRDSHKCVICESTKHLHVHHIIPISSGIDIHFLNDPFNLITMCNRCHMRHEPTNIS